MHACGTTELIPAQLLCLSENIWAEIVHLYRFTTSAYTYVSGHYGGHLFSLTDTCTFQTTQLLCAFQVLFLNGTSMLCITATTYHCMCSHCCSVCTQHYNCTQNFHWCYDSFDHKCEFSSSSHRYLRETHDKHSITGGKEGERACMQRLVVNKTISRFIHNYQHFVGQKELHALSFLHVLYRKCFIR